MKHDVGTLIMFAVRRALSDPAALREAVAGLVAGGEVDASEVDADDPLGFLRPFAASGALTEIAYRFCRHEPGAEVILTGTGDVAHLEANVEAIQGPSLPPEALSVWNGCSARSTASRATRTRGVLISPGRIPASSRRCRRRG